MKKTHFEGAQTLEKIQGVATKIESEKRVTEDDLSTLRDSIASVSETESAEIRKVATKLWNSAIAISLVPDNEMQSKESVISLRHISCDLLSVAIHSGKKSVNAETVLTLVGMLVKTGSCWAEEVKNKAMSDSAFAAADEAWSLLPPRTQSPASASAKFGALCLRARASWTLGDREISSSMVSQARSMVADGTVISTDQLIDVCLSISVDLIRDKEFSEASRILSETAETIELAAKSTVAADSRKGRRRKEKVLRLLASCRIELGDREGALSALNPLTDSGDTSPATLFLMFRIRSAATGGDSDEQLVALSSRIMKHPDLTVGIGLSMFTVLKDQTRLRLAAGCLSELSKRFSADPVAISAISLKRAEFAVSALMSEGDGDREKAMTELEEIVTPSSSTMMTPTTARDLRAIIWNAGAAAFQRKDFRASLSLFKLTLALLRSSSSSESRKGGGEGEEEAKCLRVISMIHSQLRDHGSALSAAQQSLEIGGECLTGLALSFRSRIALLAPGEGGEGEKKAVEDLKKMGTFASTDGDRSQEVLEMCAQVCFEADRSELATKALELALAAATAAGSSKQQQKRPRLSIITRALIKLVLAGKGDDASQTERCNGYLLRAAELVKSVGPIAFFGDSSPSSEEEAKWFVAVAWNLAKKAADADNWAIAKQLYLSAHVFSSLVSGTAETARMCTILAAAAALEQASAGSDDDGNSMVASEALSLIARAKEKKKSAQQPDKSAPLIALMEFRARALVSNHRREDEAALAKLAEETEKSVPGVTAGVLEAMADSLGVSTDLKVDLLRRALAMALSSGAAQQQGEKASRLVRKLVLTSTAQDRDAAWQHFETAAKLVGPQGQLKGGCWPEQEMEFLVATAWNTGVYWSRLLEWTMAERWLSLAMSLARSAIASGSTKSPSVISWFDSKTGEANRTYAEVLEKMTSSSK